MADRTLAETYDALHPPEETPPVAGKKKRGRQRKLVSPAKNSVETPEVKKGKQKERQTPLQATPIERPSRERKTVERFSSLTPQKSSAKGVSILEGPGTKLKDIPNVLFKLNKRKVDGNILHLHMILFSKKAKPISLKRNIFQFSGFSWTENEEKQRAKLREKLDKCTKDKLLDFCEILDIPIGSKATNKKEDLALKVLEFLEVPRATRDVVLAEKEQSGKKRKRKQKGSKEKKSGEKRKRGRKSSATVDNGEEKMEVEGDFVADDEEDAMQLVESVEKSKPEENTHQEEMSENDEEDEPQVSVGKKVSVKKASKAKLKAQATTKNRSNSEIVETSDSEKRKKTPKKETKMSKTSNPEKKSNAKASAKNATSTSEVKDAKRTKKNDDRQSSKPSTTTIKEKGTSPSKKTELHPTREEMHAVISKILKEVDFNTATLADILKQIEKHFNVGLMNRKMEVKSIIEEVINNMTDEDGDGDEEAEGVNGKEKSDDSEDAVA